MNRFNLNINAYAIVLMFALALFSSCNDDDDVEINQVNLTGDAWVYDRVDAGNDFANAFIDAFLEGSEYSFNSDKTYSSIQLGFESEGTWSFSDKKITLDEGEDFEQVWTVLELSKSTLHYEQTTIDDESGDESTAAYVYKR